MITFLYDYENIRGRVGHKPLLISDCNRSPAQVRWNDGGLRQEVCLPDGQALQEFLSNVCVPFRCLGRDRPPWHASWHIIVVLVLRHGLPALLRMEVVLAAASWSRRRRIGSGIFLRSKRLLASTFLLPQPALMLSSLKPLGMQRVKQPRGLSVALSLSPHATNL